MKIHETINGTISIGDRVEVFFHDGYVHARGWLVAVGWNAAFIHCDGYRGRFGKEHADWTATFRLDQIRHERTPADQLEIVVKRLSELPEPPPQRFWFRRQPQPDLRQRELDVATARAFIDHFRRTQPAPVNVRNEIIHETTDGLKFEDRVKVNIRDRKVTEDAFFVAEFRNFRHVIYPSGGMGAYPSEDVTAA